MLFFVELWLTIASFIFFFGLFGLGLVAPFSSSMRFPSLTAPFVSMLFLPMLANMIYSLANVRYAACLFTALVVAVTILVSQRNEILWRSWIAHLSFASLFVALVALILCDGRSIQVGDHAIFFKYGTDQAGYAQMSDWLLHFKATQRPFNDGGAWPYQSYPDYLFNTDPRFGSFGLLSSISLISGIGGLFVYPLATAVVIGGGAIGCAALFSKNWINLILCFFFLLGSQLIDYGYTGFLGRAIGYPGAAMLVGFAMFASDGNWGRVVATLVVSASVGTAYPGFVVGVLAASILVPYLFAKRWLSPMSTINARHLLPVVFLALFVPLLSSGFASRPIGLGPKPAGPNWWVIAMQILDVEDRVLPMTGFSYNVLSGMTIAFLVLSLGLAFFAIVRRESAAASFILGPICFVVLLMMLGRASTVQEFAGYPYTTFVLGGILLAEGLVNIVGCAWTLAILLVSFVIHIPRLLSVVSSFGYAQDPNCVITLAEFANLKRTIAGRSVEIDTGTDVGRGLWALTEFGIDRERYSLAPDTWQTMLAYRPGWRYKAPLKKPDLRLKLDLKNSVAHHFALETIPSGE